MDYITFSPSVVRQLLSSLGVTPKDFLGQNFLVSNRVAERIVGEASLSPQDTVVEVGPGFGILTQELVKRARRIIAIEKDPKLSRYLTKAFIGTSVEVVHDDALKVAGKLQHVKLSRYTIVSNLPYSISGNFLNIFLSKVHPKPEKMVLMLQKEVAQRILAQAGGMTKLSVLAQTYGDVQKCFTVSPEQFYPQPKVTSAVVRIMVKKNLPFIFPQHEELFWRLVRIGFSSKRKMLYRNLANGLHRGVDEVKRLLKMANIKENARAQELGVEAWVMLVDKYTKIY